MTRVGAALLLAAALAACVDPDPVDLVPPRTLTIAAGDDQEGPGGVDLPVEPTVLVTETGMPAAGVEVLWRVTEGGGVTDVFRTHTDQDGRAAVRWRLGEDPGSQLLYASVERAGGVTFRARSALHFSSVSSGWRHTCGLDPMGLGWCWGDNTWGQLGSGTRIGAAASTPVAGRRVLAGIAAGMVHSCAVTAAGEALCWGDNSRGQLGDGTTRDRVVPSAVLGGRQFRALAVGYVHTCGIATDGTLWCWGGNDQGQLGADPRETCGASGEPCARVPVRIELPGAVVAVAAGAAHTCAATGDERTWCWGRNDWGQLGIGSFGGARSAPALVAGESRLHELTAWGRSTCGIDNRGLAWCWGQNTSGSLGTNSTLNESSPARVAAPVGFVELGLGEAHGCGRTAEGSVYCWGAVLGNAAASPSLSPVAVSGDEPFRALAVGGAHSCAVARDVWCWGSNQYGQLGVAVDSVSFAGVPVRSRRGWPRAGTP